MHVHVYIIPNTYHFLVLEAFQILSITFAKSKFYENIALIIVSLSIKYMCKTELFISKLCEPLYKNYTIIKTTQKVG